MEDHNFLPLWYREKINKKENNKFKVYMAVMILITLIFIIRIINFENEINNLKAIEEKSIDLIKENKQKDSKLSKYNTIETFNSLMEGGYSNGFFDCIDIKTNELYVEKKVKGAGETTKLLDDLEKNKLFRILSVDIEETKQNDVLMKIKLEVK